jgi:predicted ABC-type transport system involved in lysophospholipase L1 biosynthesis ATPase subunit
MNPEQKTVALEARDLSKTYALEGAPVEVLKGVTLSVNAGETLAVMGASGSGKSTLLHCLGGLDRPTCGQVFFNGGDLFAFSAAARTALRATKLGFVFQSYHLLPELDVLENVMLPALARRGALTRRAKLEARACSLLDSVGLAARAAHRPSELSGGEQQRAALARALMNEPELVLADEPTGNLDSATGDQVLEYLFRLTRDRGHTLVMVTHNAEIAGRCNRTLILRDGKLS